MALGQFSPGPDMVLLTRTSLAHGKKAGWWMAGGIATGLVLHAGIAVAGIAVLMQANPLLEKGLSITASVYLAYLGWQLLKSFKNSSSQSMEGEAETKRGTHFWRIGLICNFLNPKAALFLAGIITPFLVARSESWWPWLLWVTIWLEGFLLWGLWAGILQHARVRCLYLKASKWIDAGFGLTLCLLAASLVLRAL